MPRQRFIWPDLWTDPVIGRLPPINQLFFIGCFSIADDEGRLLADPAYLRSAIFPYQDFPLDMIREIRDATVAKCKNMVVYQVDGTEYIALLRWTRYQHPKYPKPSTIPPLPETVSSNVPPSLGEDSSKVSLLTARGLGRDGMGRDGLVMTDSPTYVPQEAIDLLRGTKADLIRATGLRGSINSWSKKMDWALVMEAIRRGVAAKGADTSWGYIEKILIRWTKEQITSSDKLAAADEAYEQTRTKTAEAKRSSILGKNTRVVTADGEARL